MHKSASASGVDSPSAPQCSPVIQAALTFTRLPSGAKQQTSSSNLFSTSDLACLSQLITNSIRVGRRGGDEGCTVIPLHSPPPPPPPTPIHCVLASVHLLSQPRWPLSHTATKAHRSSVFYSAKLWREALKHTNSHNSSLQTHLARCLSR